MKLKGELNFDLKQLRSYLCILEEGSFTRASRKLKIGQSTISHQINSLEEVLGLSLIDRSSKDVAVTPEGKIFRAFCEKLFEDIETLKAGLKSGISGTAVRISASSIPSSYILPEVIAGIGKNVPECYFNVETVNSREAIELVKEGKAEVGVVGKTVKHPALTYDYFFSDEIILIGYPGAPDRLKPGEIKDHRFIVREKGSGTRDAYEKALIQYDIKPSDLKTVFECTTSEMVKRSVMSGMGLSFISRLAISDEVKLGKIKIIKVEGLRINREFYIVHPLKKLLSNQARIFVTELQKYKKKK